MTQTTVTEEEVAVVSRLSSTSTYDRWMESLGIPIYRGYYIEDLRTIELGWWADRGCNAAIIQVEGQKGVSETRVSEIPPGATLPPQKLGMDELVYVLQGNGLTSVWRHEDGPRHTFEWQPHSLFLVPRHQYHQFSNTRGTSPVRLLHFNYLPLGMAASNSPEFFFNSRYEEPEDGGGERYAEAKSVKVGDDNENDPFIWYGNFFPDMRAWDRLSTYQRRGGGGHHVRMQFPNSEMSGHMSVFPVGTYKKAHRHGPGVVIVIPAGEGYSIMWPEGKEKVIVPWHECSLFVPPNRWFHQHFNVGTIPARYLALHPARTAQMSGRSEQIEDRARDQIEYPDEDRMVRDYFEEQVTKHGGKSLMPAEAYQDHDYKWSFKGDYTAPGT